MAAFRRIANLFRGSRMSREIDAELQSHIDLRTEANLAAGMSPAEARRDALVRFGNPAVTREHVAAADAVLGVEGLVRDVRYGLRQLRRSPGFAATAILTLALGIGSTVVVFGILNALLLKPINVPVAGGLYELVHEHLGSDNQSYPDYVDFRARNAVFTGLAGYRFAMAGVSFGGHASRSWLYEVSGNYFDTLGVQPQLGRFFHASDEHGPDSAPYIVLSDGFWRSRFNADPAIVGRVVDLNRHPFTILGVAPRGFNGTEIFFWPDFFMPIVNEAQIEGYSFLNRRGNHGMMAIGVLKPGITPAQATQSLTAVAHQMEREHPQEDDGLSVRLIQPGLMGDTLGGPARPFLGVLMALALLLLVAACVNLAGIFAARAADRGREMAIRLSIGSTRSRILRQLVTESLLIALAGGAGGTALAWLLLAALSRWSPIPQFPLHLTVTPDARVYLAAIGLSFLSGLLPGLLPARLAWRTDPIQVIKAGTSTAAGRRRFSLRDVLLGVQIAVCALLVTASLVAVRGMVRSLHAPIGFQPDNALLAIADLHMAGYTDDSALPVERRMIEETARIPGVAGAGIINNSPLGGSGSDTSVYKDGVTDVRPSNSAFDSQYYSVSPGYMGAAGTRLLAGRDLRWTDGPTAPKVALVNQTFARLMFGSAPAVGNHFVGGDKTRYEVVGVVEDGKYQFLTEAPTAAVFYPLPQSTDATAALVVRSTVPPAEIAAALNRTLTGIDPSLPFSLSRWMDMLALAFFPARAAAVALGVMGLLAAMLAITGIFGMAAYSVSRRLRELGIRAALGAHRLQLMASALARPCIVLLCGTACGLILGILASRLMASLVYEASPRDPLVLAGALAAMVLVGLVATWMPARRALSVNPARLLREQ